MIEITSTFEKIIDVVVIQDDDDSLSFVYLASHIQTTRLDLHPPTLLEVLDALGAQEALLASNGVAAGLSCIDLYKVWLIYQSQLFHLVFPSHSLFLSCLKIAMGLPPEKFFNRFVDLSRVFLSTVPPTKAKIINIKTPYGPTAVSIWSRFEMRLENHVSLQDFLDAFEMEYHIRITSLDYARRRIYVASDTNDIHHRFVFCFVLFSLLHSHISHRPSRLTDLLGVGDNHSPVSVELPFRCDAHEIDPNLSLFVKLHFDPSKKRKQYYQERAFFLSSDF